MTLRFHSYRFYYKVWFYMLPLLSFALARYLRFGYDTAASREDVSASPFYVVVMLVTTLLWGLLVDRYKLTSIHELFHENSGILKTASATATTYLVVLCLLFFYREQSLSRLFIVFSAGILLFMTLLSRVMFRRFFRRTYGRRTRLRVLVVGADGFAVNIARQLERVPMEALQIVGHIRLPQQESTVRDVPVFDMSQVQRGLPLEFDDVVVAVQPALWHYMSDIVRSLEALCAPVRAVLDLGGMPVVRERLFEFGDLQMFDVAMAAHDSPYYFVLKRGFDVVFSLFAVVCLGPLMIGIAILVKATSPGPVLFAQERVGLNGKRFWMYKFRSMRVAPPGEGDTRWTTANDNRRTVIGTWLRKSSLDELPQFFNVLKGDMSVVGPRPERPFFVNKFLEDIAHYNTRHRLKVGMTGWAQVNGWRGDTGITRRLEHDLYYLQNWSFWFDLRIVWLTIWSGLFGKNAY